MAEERKQMPNFFNGENQSYSDTTGYYLTSNLDVHSEIGMAQTNLALATESSTPNEECFSELVSNGDIFFASTTSGKIWKRTSAGVYSLVHTNTQGANCGIALWQGYLYYWSSTKLGRITEAFASSQASWSSQVDTFGTFTTNTSYHPMAVVGSGLYIGDGFYVDLVDSTGTFILSALDIPTVNTVSALGATSDDIMVGTIIGTNIAWCMVYVWNRISPSYTWFDRVPETGVNCFLKMDNVDAMQCGTSGRIYSWSGQRAVRMAKAKGVTTTVNPYNSTEYQGRTLIAMGSKIFSFYRENSSFPYALVGEYTAPGTIKSIIATINGVYVSANNVISNIGITYANATLTTYEADGQFKDVWVRYKTLTGSIGIETSVDGGSFTAQTPIVDTVRKMVRFNGGLGYTNTLQARITLNGYVLIKSIELM